MESHHSSLPSTNNIKSLNETRRSAKYHPTIWGDYFLSFDSHKTEITVAEHEELAKQKEMVKKLLAGAGHDYKYKMELIDAIQRLGVDYHFENEIDEFLQTIRHSNGIEDDLRTVALRFRLLRQQGYNVPCDVFNNFFDKEGNFVDSIKDDVEGLLSLWEAANLGTHGEEILDKAMELCSSHLHQIQRSKGNVSLSRRVEQALKMPIRKTVPRLGARMFISSYEEDKSHNQTLLKFAKLDFNMVQKMQQRELSDITKWWKQFHVDKRPYIKDRIVELHYWFHEVYFEARYATARSIVARITSIIVITDDTYEYATFDELQILTDAIQRWDVNDTLEGSPPHIQLVYKSLIQTFAEFEDDLERAGESYRLQYVKQQMKTLVKAYFEETKWLYNNYVPTLEEYMNVSIITSVYPIISTMCLVGMGDEVRKEDFDWVVSVPLIVRASAMVSRLMDDMVGDKYEQKPSSVQCYMKQYGVSRDEACAELGRQVKNAWKDMNGECLEPAPASMRILMRIVNLARVIHLLYTHDDCFANSVESKEWLKMVLADPLQI